MMKACVATAFLCALLTLTFNGTVSAQNPCPFRAPVGEAGLRKTKATKRVKPVYPEQSLKNKVTGRVVVEILVDENGKVPLAKLREAPDELMGQAVVEAAKRWEFKPPPKIQGRQLCYSSTLSFKFEIKDGKGKVVDDPSNYGVGRQGSVYSKNAER
ncbi:MAG TPA: energy transducer TonB [Pyrinomonadaceae bacterium]|nr:energy transducer TonB [Pyrinomonadaceae bacterium]